MEQRKRIREYWAECRWDVRYTFRKLARDPGFAAISILILGLAIGANVAVFSVVNTLLLRPLPFPQSQELVWIAPPPSACGLSCATYSADAYEELRAMSRVYQDVTGYESFTGADNLRLTGTAKINGTGNALDNTLDGSQNTAANTLSGSTGNDTYIIGTGDVVTEAASAGTWSRSTATMPRGRRSHSSSGRPASRGRALASERMRLRVGSVNGHRF